ncbi:S1C family serine protease [Anatilimnocola floriformis]|uniref:S1C family serine protease n=1 Tax=Anatilimnocola floriformis TaxID=2948575 RepID=UPI0020C4B268|nr:S1C family serine protease [Anatilimnocola floriformis]
MTRTFLIFALLLAASAPLPLCAQQATGDWKGAAAKLQQSVVTVRIRRMEAAKPAAEEKAADELSGKEETKPAPQASVMVCTGFCVSPNKVVTATLVASDDRVRLTLAGGVQSDAKLLAVDEYSGLSLLGCEGKELTPLKLAADAPDVGEQVMTGAAWGVDRPIVSVGIVGAVERTLTGLLLPPLLQCDLRTVETSSGSPLANRAAEVLGIILAIDEPVAQRGWTYAVPASHISRLVRSVEAANGNGVVVLKRRRPVVGMVLDGNEEMVLVQRITAGGPADKAGLKVGDRIVAVNGVLIRSTYQAVLPTMYKQPGDTIRYRVERDAGEIELTITLGGGVELPQLPHNQLGQLILPRVEVGRSADGNYFAQSSRGHVRELAVPLPADKDKEPLPPTAEQKIDLLIKSLERYQAVIDHQQREIKSLREELKKK